MIDMLKRNLKGFVWDPFIIGIYVFVLFITLPILTGIGNNVTQQVIANNPGLTSNQIAELNTLNTSFFNNSPDIMILVLYFMLIIAAFVAAGYEGANPAVTLLLGMFFIVIAEVVSFALSDFAHGYITQVAYLNIAKHYGLSTYLMEYLPVFNGILTIAYMIFVISKREQISSGFSGAVST